MKNLMTSFLCLSVLTVHAQHLKVDNGILISRFYNKDKLPILPSTITNYSINVGIDYSEHSWLFLSSQIGYSRVGGREKNAGISVPEFEQIVEQKNISKQILLLDLT